MQKGSSGLLVTILIAFLVALPITFWVVSKSLSEDASVKGAATIEEQNAKPGFLVNIVANSGGWELVEYVCTSLDQCTSSATSGSRWASVGGGQTAGHQVVVDYSGDLESYTYMKLLVKSGWGDSLKSFKISDAGAVPNSKTYTLKSDTATYDVVIFPLIAVKDVFYTSATFSDQ